MIGIRCESAIALAKPVEDPPPTLTTKSASELVTALRADSASSTGTCCLTSVQVETNLLPTKSSIDFRSAIAPPSIIKKTFCAFSSETSAPKVLRTPGPKTILRFLCT